MGTIQPTVYFFRYDGKECLRISLSELPVEFKNINLIVDTNYFPQIKKNSKDAGYVSFESVIEINGNLRQPEYKTILREPLLKEKIDRMCTEMVFYKGAWVGPGDSIGKRIQDSK